MKSTDQSNHYQICIEGKLNDRWLRWFEGLEVISSPDGQTRTKIFQEVERPQTSHQEDCRAPQLAKQRIKG